MFAFLVGVYSFYIGGRIWGSVIAEVSRFLILFTDVLAFPILVVSISVAYKTNDQLSKLFGVLTSIGMVFFTLCYNLLNCSKFPKAANMFQVK